MTTARYRDQLADVRERTGQARDRIARAKRDRQAAVDSWDGRDMQSPEARRAQLADQAIRAAEADLDVARDEESALLHQMSGMSVPQHSSLTDPSTMGQLEALAYSSQQFGQLSLGTVIPADRLAGMIEAGDWGAPRPMAQAPAGQVTVTDAMRRAGGGGPSDRIVAQPRRALRILDRLNTAVMPAGRSFEYVREVATADGADVVVEGALKPATTIEFEDDEAVAQTLAHHTRLKRQALADVPGLDSVVQGRLTYGVLAKLEAQVLNGSGVDPNLRGILQTSGIGATAYDGAVPLADLPLDAITDIIVSEANPDTVVIHPSDWSRLVRDRADDGHYRGSGPFASQTPTLWGLPVVVTAAMTEGTALIGDFANGATVFIREGVSVRMSDSDQDAFVRIWWSSWPSAAPPSRCGARPASRPST
jgi:HK97 family phage major capsid protein